MKTSGMLAIKIRIFHWPRFNKKTFLCAANPPEMTRLEPHLGVLCASRKPNSTIVNPTNCEMWASHQAPAIQ
jgi:hypothetical protein